MSQPAVPTSPSLAVKAAGSTILSLGSQVLQTLLGFGTAAALTIWLRPDDYGVFAMATTIVGFVGVLGDAGLSQTLVRRPQLDSVAEASGFAMSILAGLVLTAVSLAAAPLLGLYFGRRDVGIMAAIVSTNFLIMAPSRVSYAKLMRGLRYGALSAVALLSSLLSAAGSVVAAAFGAGGWSLVLSFLSAPLIITAAYLSLEPPAVGRRHFSRSVARELSAFGARLSGFSLAIAIAWFPGTVLLGRLSGPAAVGLYNMGMRLIALPTGKVSGAFASVFLPAISQVDPTEQRRTYRATLRMLAMFTAPVALGLLAISDEMVTILPRSWSGLGPTLKIFAAGAVMESLGSMPTMLLTVEGRSAAVLRLGLLSIPLAWIAFGIAAWVGGTEAFATAWAATNFIGGGLFLSVAAGNRKEAIEVLTSLVRPIAVAGLMSVGVALLLWVTGTAGRRPGLPIGILGGVAIQVGLCRLFLPAETRRAVNLIRAAMSRRRRS